MVPGCTEKRSDLSWFGIKSNHGDTKHEYKQLACTHPTLNLPVHLYLSSNEVLPPRNLHCQFLQWQRLCNAESFREQIRLLISRARSSLLSTKYDCENMVLQIILPKQPAHTTRDVGPPFFFFFLTGCFFSRFNDYRHNAAALNSELPWLLASIICRG